MSQLNDAWSTGRRWQKKLGRDLPVSSRTVCHWLSGKRRIRPVIAARIRAVANG